MQKVPISVKGSVAAVGFLDDRDGNPQLQDGEPVRLVFVFGVAGMQTFRYVGKVIPEVGQQLDTVAWARVETLHNVYKDRNGNERSFPCEAVRLDSVWLPPIERAGPAAPGKKP